MYTCRSSFQTKIFSSLSRASLSPSALRPFELPQDRRSFEQSSWSQKTLEMNLVRRHALSLFGRPSQTIEWHSAVQQQQLQQWRGIRVKVRNGNLEQALGWMKQRMTSSGMERLIKSQPTRHIKNSEKRVLARKNLERKIRSQDLARKLKSILVKKVRGL